MEQIYELNLRDYLTIFLKRKWEFIISFLVVSCSIFFYTALQTPIYQASALLKVEQFPFLPSESVFPGRLVFQRQLQLSDYAKQLLSTPIVEKAATELGWINEYSSENKKANLIGKIAGSLSASEIENSSMIRLEAQLDDPRKAADIVNKVAEIFKEVNVERNNSQTRNVRVFIEETLKDISSKLKEQGERMRALTTMGVVGSGIKITEQISQLEKSKAELLAKFTAGHPNVISLVEQIELLKDELKKLPKEEFEYSVLKRDIAINENLYGQLQTNLQTAKIKEAEQIDNVIIVNPAFVSGAPSYPNKAKNYMIGIILGLVLGLTVSLITEHIDTSIGRVDDIESFIKIGVVGIIPFCSGQYKNKGKAEKRKGISLFKRREPQGELKPAVMLELEKTDSSSLFMEAFRLLGVNLQVLFGKGGKIQNKIIMITSSKPEEGKTVTVSTLGLIMCQMGYKVLIIDGDVRRAHIHKNFGLKQKEGGLTDILTGKITEDAAIKTATDIMLGTTCIDRIIEKPWLNNLNIITAGSTFPNTINLFNSKKLDELLAYFRNKYDIILLDTSPILAVSEPSILLPKVDGVLLVYRAGSTSRLALRRAKIQIEGVKGKGSISGIILNNVTPEIGMDTYYYYNKKYYSDEKLPPGLKKEGSGKNV